MYLNKAVILKNCALNCQWPLFLPFLGPDSEALDTFLIEVFAPLVILGHLAYIDPSPGACLPHPPRHQIQAENEKEREKEKLFEEKV